MGCGDAVKLLVNYLAHGPVALQALPVYLADPNPSTPSSNHQELAKFLGMKLNLSTLVSLFEK